MPKLNGKPPFKPSLADAVLTFALACAIRFCVLVEWTWPGCAVAKRANEYGAFAVWGKPLPYYQFSGVSSLEYNFVPLLYGVNFVFVGLVAGMVVVLFRRYFRLRIGLVPALAICIPLAALCALEDYLFLAWAVPELRDVYSPLSLRELRPVSVRFAGPSPYDCTPGPFG